MRSLGGSFRGQGHGNRLCSARA